MTRIQPIPVPGREIRVTIPLSPLPPPPPPPPPPG